VILEQIDQLLADWRKKVDLVGHNLMDLYGLPTYQRLCGTSGFPKAQLTGITHRDLSQSWQTDPSTPAKRQARWCDRVMRR